MGKQCLANYLGVVLVKFSKHAFIVGGIAAIGAALLINKMKNSHPTNQNAWYAQEIQSGAEYTPAQIQLIAAEHHDSVAVVEAKISATSYDNIIDDLDISDFSKQRLKIELSSINPAYQDQVFADEPPIEKYGNLASAWNYAHGVNG